MFNENNFDNQSMISQQVQQRAPNQVIYQQQAIKTVNIEEIVQEYAASPSEIYKYYQSLGRDITQKQLVDLAEMYVNQFASKQDLLCSCRLDVEIEQANLSIKQFQNLLKTLLNKDNDLVLQQIQTQSYIVKEFIHVMSSDIEFIQYKLDLLQKELEMLEIQKQLGNKHFMICRPRHQAAYDNFKLYHISCKALQKINKVQQQQQQPQQIINIENQQKLTQQPYQQNTSSLNYENSILQ